MILPYKVKNPPRRFPAATVMLIGLNVIVYATTTHSLLVIRREMVEQYALVWGVSSPITILTAMFLHGDIFHLLGNMLFLWVFGPAVEDRLGIGLYAGLYLLAGFAGDVAQAALGAAGAIGAAVPTLGASGCIMGVLGAYWYMYAWSPVCMFYWIGWFWRGTFEVAAVWVIGTYFLLDLANGFLGRSLGVVGGVANFAHVGGSLVGALLVAGLGVKRDSGEVSKVKAAHAEVKDVNLLTCQEMWMLVRDSPEDENLLARYALKAMRDGGAAEIKYALQKDMRTIVTHCPEVAIHYLLVLNGPRDMFSPGDLLYLARWCESNNRPNQVLSIYGLIESDHPNSPELEVTLFRTAAIYWHKNHNGHGALVKLNELLTKFPQGKLMFEAEDLRDEIIGRCGGEGLKAA